MTTQTARLADGNSYSWEFPTGGVTDIGVDVDATPTDVDVESKGSGQPDSAYSRVSEFQNFYGGARTVTTTGTKEFTLSTGGDVIRVTVTNNSGAAQTPTVTVTPGTPQRTFREDGKAMVDAKETNSESVNAAEESVKSDDQTRQVGPTDIHFGSLTAAESDLPSSGGHIRLLDRDLFLSSSYTPGDNIRLTGQSRENAFIKDDGVSGHLIDATDATYFRLGDIKLGGGGSADGVKLSRSTPAPTHQRIHDAHIVNCVTGISVIDAEESWIGDGRIGGCETAIHHSIPTGFGRIDGTELKDYTSVGITTDTNLLVAQSVVFASEQSPSTHIKLTGDVDLLVLRNCWFEQGPPVIDLNGNTLQNAIIDGGEILVSGGTTIIKDSGSGGGVDNITIGGGVDIKHNDTNQDQDVTIFGVNPTTVQAGGIKTFGAATGTGSVVYGNIGFRHALSPSTGLTDFPTFGRATKHSPQDLTAAGAPAPSELGVYAHHDGTGTPAAGLYRSNPANSQWVRVADDGATTIAY